MQLNRRKLLGGVAAAALTAGSAQGQVLTSGGKIVTSGGNVVLAPPVPAPSAGGLLSTQVTLTNPAGQPTQVNPYFSFGLPIARSQYPATGFKLALYDAPGSTKITDLQVDQTASGWVPDGSRNYAVITGRATGTTLAAGATATFTVKAEAGTPPATPVCTTATLAANSDIKAVCVIGTDTFTVSVNTIIANFSGAPATNPQGSIRQWKSGPTACEWSFGQYLKRDSDGGYHRWAYLKLYVTALSATGPFIVRGLLEDVQSYGANPQGTVGTVAVDAPPVVVDSIDVFNGASFIGALGGVNDLNNGTFAPANVNISQAGMTPTFQGGLTASQVLSSTPRNPIGFVTTGTLPAGLGPASTTTYWAAIDPANRAIGTVIPCTSRLFATRIVWAGFVKMAAPTSGLSVAINKWIYSNGGVYYSSAAGVSTGAQPTGAVFADNSAGGTLVWTLISAQITSQGTGTHTMVMKAAISGASKAPIMAPDTYPFWSGAGSLPKLVVGYDRNYVVGQTKCCPPLDPAIVATPWVGTLPRYVQNMTLLPGNLSLFDIGDGGEATMDERINMFSPTAFASICLPTDVGMAMSCRLMALSFMDRELFWRDERAQQIPVVNYGPTRLGNSTYPGMPPLNTGLALNSGSPTGSPARIRYSGWNGYGGSYSDNQTGDATHIPHIFYWPAITTGDPMFFDASLELASFVLASSGSGQQIRTGVFGGLNYTAAFPLFEQVRGIAHTLKIFSQCEWIWPDNHPAKPYLTDVMDDTAVFATLWTNAHVGPNGQSVGFIPSVIAPPSPNGVFFEPWMMGYLQIAVLGEVLKGNRPGFRTFIENYLWKAWLPLYDSDVGGSEQLIDAQWTVIASPSAVNPPAESSFMLTVPNRWTAVPVVFKAFTVIPPPTKLFIHGILSAQSQTTYVYRNPGVSGQAWTANAYGLTTRAACEMGAMAGIPVYTKIADRINAFIASFYSNDVCNWTLQGPNGVGTSPGNNNGLMYAMKRQ